MFRRLFTLLALSVVATATTTQAAGLVSSRSVQAAPVVAVQAASIADIVLLGAGFDSGLRQGMVCRVTRDGVQIAEIVLVDLRPRASAALIVQLAPDQTIRPGDTATVKTLKA